jgi:hypothetical protein
MILSQYHIFELDTINIYSVVSEMDHLLLYCSFYIKNSNKKKKVRLKVLSTEMDLAEIRLIR